MDGIIEFLSSMSGTLTVTGDLDQIKVKDDFGGTITITGDLLGTSSIATDADADFLSTGLLDIEENLDGLLNIGDPDGGIPT